MLSRYFRSAADRNVEIDSRYRYRFPTFLAFEESEDKKRSIHIYWENLTAAIEKHRDSVNEFEAD